MSAVPIRYDDGHQGTIPHPGAFGAWYCMNPEAVLPCGLVFAPRSTTAGFRSKGQDLIAADVKAIRLGHPSYVWRRGQDRRLSLIRQHVDLEGRRILDVGCGLGMYV